MKLAVSGAIFRDMIDPAQCRAARGLLKWTQQELADAADVGLTTVKDLESGERRTIARNQEAIRRALEQAGVEFIEENGGGAGVRLRE